MRRRCSIEQKISLIMKTQGLSDKRMKSITKEIERYCTNWKMRIKLVINHPDQKKKQQKLEARISSTLEEVINYGMQIDKSTSIKEKFEKMKEESEKYSTYNANLPIDSNWNQNYARVQEDRNDEYKLGAAEQNHVNVDPSNDRKNNYAEVILPKTDPVIPSSQYKTNLQGSDIMKENILVQPKNGILLESSHVEDYEKFNIIDSITDKLEIKEEMLPMQTILATTINDSKTLETSEIQDNLPNVKSNKHERKEENLQMETVSPTRITESETIKAFSEIQVSEHGLLNETLKSDKTDASGSSGISSQVGFDRKINRNNVKTSTPERQIAVIQDNRKKSDDQFCSFCKYNTRKLGDLRKHQKTVHDQILDKYCKLCNFSTSRADNLTRHVNDIHGTDLFSCNFCLFQCTRKDNLKTHIKLWHQQNEDPCYECKFCSAKYYYKQSLSRHIKKDHRYVI